MKVQNEKNLKFESDMKFKLQEAQHEIHLKMGQRFDLENEVADIQPEAERPFTKFMKQKGLDGNEVLTS